jgi:hypothetical protein
MLVRDICRAHGGQKSGEIERYDGIEADSGSSTAIGEKMKKRRMQPKQNEVKLLIFTQEQPLFSIHHDGFTVGGF